MESMQQSWTRLLASLLSAVTLLSASGCGGKGGTEILNVSYDPTRELWKDLNGQFAAQWEKDNGGKLRIKQSHGGSGSQARAVNDGLEADVVTLAIPADTDAIRKKGLIEEGWEKELPNDSLPFASTIVFVVRKGNPHGIADWGDIVKDGVQVITPNPKTSGNGKLSYLALWGWAIKNGKTPDEAKELVRRLYAQVPVLDTAARAASMTFAEKRIGDVHLTWENEAHLELKDFSDLEIVYPKSSILAEPKVAVVDANVDKHGTRAVSEAYLKFLYTDAAQETLARHYYRPTNPTILAKHAATLKPLELFPITSFEQGWDEAFKKHFSEGGVFDSIYTKK